jgi:predicted transcriptional regulator YdeE
MLLTNIQTKTAEAFTFLYGEEVVNPADIPATGQKLMDGLQDLVQQAFIEIVNDAVWAYEPIGDMMTLKAGFPVRAETKVVKPFFVEVVPEWQCLSALYTGPMDPIKDAWAEMYEEIQKRGLTTAGEFREIYRVWVDFGSDENVTELQVRLK